MKQNLIFIAMLFCTIFIFAMEEREKPTVKSVSPKLKTYLDLDKLPIELRNLINKFRIFELEQLPDELIMPIFLQLAQGPKVEENLSMASAEEPIISPIQIEKEIINGFQAIHNLRLISKRFDNLVNSVPFINVLINYWSKKFGIKPVFLAVLWNIPGIKAWLKVQDKEILSERDWKGITALMKYVQDNDYNRVKVLLEAGADINEEEDGEFEDTTTALFYAKTAPMIKLLVEHGANIHQIETYKGRNILFNAIDIQDTELIEFLIAKGVDLNNLDDFGFTPLAYAISKLKCAQRWYTGSEKWLPTTKYQAIIEILKKHGAK